LSSDEILEDIDDIEEKDEIPPLEVKIVNQEKEKPKLNYNIAEEYENKKTEEELEDGFAESTKE